MSTTNILSILGYPQSSYLLVYYIGLSLVHCSYISIGSLHAQIKWMQQDRYKPATGDNMRSAWDFGTWNSLDVQELIYQLR